MGSVSQELSPAARKTFNKLKKEFGDAEVLETLIGEHKNFTKVEAERQKLAEKLDYSKEKIAELTKQLKEQPAQSEATQMQSPDTISMLNETIAAMKSLNDSYARENERLLKITNFSEYDEKINGLKAEISELSHMCTNLKESLRAEKEKAVNFEMKSIKLDEEKTETEAALESSKKESARLVEKVAAAEGTKAQLESTVTSYVEELRRYKTMIEELKSHAPMQAEQETEAPTYS